MLFLLSDEPYILICALAERVFDEFFSELERNPNRNEPACRELSRRMLLKWFTSLFKAFVLDHSEVGPVIFAPYHIGERPPVQMPGQKYLVFDDPLNVSTYYVTQEAVAVSCTIVQSVVCTAL